MEILEDNTHLFAESRDRLPLDVVDVESQHHGFLRLIMVEFAIQGLEERTFPRPHLSYDVNEVSFIHLQTDVFEHDISVLHDIYFLVIDKHMIIV